VAYNSKTGKYSLLLDRCILNNKTVVRKIVSELCLTNEAYGDGYRHPLPLSPLFGTRSLTKSFPPRRNR
jgi:hypothetical protein